MQLLKEGYNCWKISSAGRASFLVDGENYYREVYKAILSARKRIFIAGWDIDSKLELVRDRSISGDLPTSLKKILDYVLSVNPSLEVYILTWDFNPVFLKERELFSEIRFKWKKHKNLFYHKDNAHPFTGSQHEKLIVVDDQLAFCGGLDLTANRWDTRSHLRNDVLRVNSNGDRYDPFHDVALMVEGIAALDLGELLRERWYRATGKKLKEIYDPLDTNNFNHFDWDIEDVTIGIARTRPVYKNFEEVREIERLYVDMIKLAKKEIFIENQYFSSKVISNALMESLSQPDGPMITMILPLNSGGLIQDRTIGQVQNVMLKKLYQVDKYNRLGVFCPIVRGTRFFKIHSKLTVVDDKYFRVGSANTINRSMGLDTECDLLIDGSESKELIDKFRLWKLDIVAEHLNVEREVLEKKIAELGTLNRAIGALSSNSGSRYLQLMEIEKYQKLKENITFSELCDLESPSRVDLMFDFIYLKTRQVKDRFDGSFWFKSGFWLSLLMVLFLILSIFIDKFSSAEMRTFIALNTGIFAQFVVVPLLFALASILLIPLNILVIVVATFFPFKGALVTLILGMSLAILIDYAIGLMFKDNKIFRKFLKEYKELRERLNNIEFLPIVLLRIVPVLPFSIINFVAGTLRLNLLKFWTATLVGVLPSALMILLFQKSLLKLVSEPTIGRGLVFGMMFVLVFLVGSFIKKRMLRY